MADKCQKCGRKLEDRTDRFCPRHARELLREMETSGYLEPLVVRTMDGESKLSNRKYLTLTDQFGMSFFDS